MPLGDIAGGLARVIAVASISRLGALVNHRRGGES
jgi:hypothetical protein